MRHAQELAYEGYIKRSRELTQEANLDILDIEANYRKDIPSTELEDFRTSLHNIKCETSAVYNDLCTWKTSLARHPAGANKECEATTETNHTTLTQSSELEQDGDTKRDETVETQDRTSTPSGTRTTSDTKGDKTINDNVPCEDHGCPEEQE